MFVYMWEYSYAMAHVWRSRSWFCCLGSSDLEIARLTESSSICWTVLPLKPFSLYLSSLEFISASNLEWPSYWHPLECWIVGVQHSTYFSSFSFRDRVLFCRQVAWLSFSYYEADFGISRTRTIPLCSLMCSTTELYLGLLRKSLEILYKLHT